MPAVSLAAADSPGSRQRGRMMEIVSRRTRYALHGLAYMSHSDADDRPVPREEIIAYLRVYSQRLTLSPSYIGKIFQEVSRAGFTRPVAGQHGGYRLARSADEIRVVDVVEALDGPLLTGCCLLSVGSCNQESGCGMRAFLTEAERRLHGYLEQHTVASLARMMSFPSPDEIGLQRD